MQQATDAVINPHSCANRDLSAQSRLIYAHGQPEVKAILDYVDSFPYIPNSDAYAHRRLSLQQKDSIGRVRDAEWERLERERAKALEEEEP